MGAMAKLRRHIEEYRQSNDDVHPGHIMVKGEIAEELAGVALLFPMRRKCRRCLQVMPGEIAETFAVLVVRLGNTTYFNRVSITVEPKLYRALTIG